MHVCQNTPNKRQMVLQFEPALLTPVRQGFWDIQSHASAPNIFKLHAEDLRRAVHGFHPGIYIYISSLFF